MPLKCDVLIVGAGFSGLTFAERCCTQQNLSCIVVDRRDHIGGNSYDEYDDAGVLIHKYGPHYFRTNSDKVKLYLSTFTDWKETEYRVLSYSEGRYWSFPINLKTFEQMLGRPSTTLEFEEWLSARKRSIPNPKNSEEVILAQVGEELYERFFRNYTKKQWRREPKDLDQSVCGRIPIRTTRDDRYFSERFQALPAAGYTKMFNRMVKACGSKIQLLLNCDYREVESSIKYDTMVYTGPIDDYFNRCYGPLPYRSLRFERESFDAIDLKRMKVNGVSNGFWQPALQVNYPNSEEYTRIVELKHATRQLCSNTTIVKEFPQDYCGKNEPYYPIPAPDSARLFEQYQNLVLTKKNIIFLGRLARYKYYNMDQVVALALAEWEQWSASRSIS
jgi:UDP-galactopyranose mutase